MKKTMIAMAVAGVVAAPIASAEVSISGKVEQTFTWVESTTSATDELGGGSDAKLVFAASEDLGNGMTGFATSVIDMDTIATTQDVKVGVSGGFGTVVMGRMEDFSESKVLSMVDVLGGTSIELGDQNAQRTSHGFAYVSPAMSGLTVGVAGYAIDDTANNIDDWDASDVALMYSNGPLTVNISREEFNANTSALEDEKITSVGVGYKMGDLSVAVVSQDIDNAAGAAANDHTDTMLSAVYTMGNNSIAFGWNENELTTGATDDNITALEFRHNFSARTRAYVGGTSDSYATSSSDTDTVYMGLEHSF